MREIKLRAWHPSVGMTMTPVLSTSSYTGRVVCTGYDKDLHAIELPLMQFTGLKDKNGVDIYEGDIIPYGGKNYAVGMCGPSWTFPGYVGVDYYSHDEPELQDWSEFEVIGNIYENPELISE